MSNKKVLFVCSGNYDRSPTAQKLFSNINGIITGSAGTGVGDCETQNNWGKYNGPHQIGLDDLNWADYVLVMKERQKEIIKKNFPEWFAEKKGKIKVLEIEDEYFTIKQKEELKKFLLEKVAPLLEKLV